MKKFLTFILVLAMVMSVSSFAMAYTSDSGADATTAVASITVGTDTYYYSSLQNAISAVQNGHTVTLLKDCAENVTVTQVPDVKITIDGNKDNGITMTGTITVDGKSAGYDTAGVTIKNFSFDAKNISKDACINLGGNNSIRYTRNVTVENCTFTDSGTDVNDKVGIKQYTGGCKYLTVTGCEATKLHSLMQLKNVEVDLVIDKCKVTDSGSGISVGCSADATVKNCEINVDGYGIRVDGHAIADVTIEDTDVTAEKPVVIRKATGSADLDISDKENTFTPTSGGDPIVLTNGDDEDPVVAPTGTVNQTGSTPAKNGNTYYTDVDTAKSEAKPGDVVEITKDDGTIESIVPNPAPSAPPSSEPTTKPSTGSGISVKYNGGNSFSTSKSDVPTGVEIDGVPVTFNGTGSNFTVGCISSDAKWVTVRWNSTTVTTNFTPDGLVECTTVSIPKTGDMSIWAAVSAFFGF